MARAATLWKNLCNPHSQVFNENIHNYVWFIYVQGPKGTPINVSAQNYTNTTLINVTWKPIEDELILEKMLGYRVSYRAVMIGDEEVKKEQPTYNFTVRKTTLQAVIQGLETYTRYQINVSGFTRKGDGPGGIILGGIVTKLVN